MADATYTTKVYFKDGGDTLVVASGGKILIETGGGFFPNSGTQAAAITKPVATGTTQSSPYGFATAAQGDAAITAINAIIDALKNAGITL